MIPLTAFQSIHWWYEQINNYAYRQLTFSKDRFPALSGLAKEFSDRTGYHYKAGIWLEDFRRGLLWSALGNEVNLSHSPSWSWAAVVGNGQNFSIYRCGNSFWSYLESKEAEIIDIFVETVGNNAFGQVISAKLCLHGLCHTPKTIWDANSFVFEEDWKYGGKERLDTKSHPEPGVIHLYMDTKDDSLQILWERNVLVMHIARFAYTHFPLHYEWEFPEDEKRENAFALLLQPNAGSNETYRRIGIAEMPHAGSEELGWEMKTVTIV